MANSKRNKDLCVKVARDVLAQLRLKRYFAEPGTYVNLNFDTYEDNVRQLSFKDFFKENKEATCNVCALGAAFVSLINIKNKCSVDEIDDHSTIFDRLEEVFGQKNMALMESAFESVRMVREDYDDYDMLNAAADWGTKFYDDNQRLRAIMLNVVRNGGDFKLPKKTLERIERQASSQYMF